MFSPSDTEIEELAEYIYHSMRIDGHNMPYEGILNTIKYNDDGPEEVLSLYNSLIYIRQSSEYHLPLMPHLNEVHRIYYKSRLGVNAGMFRSYDLYVHHASCPKFKDLRNVVRVFDEAMLDLPLLTTPEHAMHIHNLVLYLSPFEDGNGSLARLMANWVSWRGDGGTIIFRYDRTEEYKEQFKQWLVEYGSIFNDHLKTLESRNQY